MAATALLTGCVVADAPSSAGSVMRDSAGVMVIENRSPAWSGDPRWTVAAEPRVRIGRIDGPPEYQFSRMIGATRLSDGRIAVADAGTRQIRFYAADGRHLETVGGEGEGPGEFKRPAVFRRLEGDSLLIHDLRLDRSSIFSRDGAYARSFTLGAVGNRSANPTVPLADGRLAAAVSQPVMTAEFRARAESGAVLDGTTLMLLYTMDGIPLDTIGEFPLPERYVSLGRSGISIMAYPFARTLVTASWADRLYVGWSGDSEVRRYGPDGVLERIIRLGRAPRAVTEADLDRFRDERLADAPSENQRRELERLYSDIEIHETLPSFDDFLVDAEGYLWVERANRPGRAAAEWDVFDPEGRWLGIIDLPDGLNVYEIGGDHLIGKMEDELGVERVVVFDLTRFT